MAPISQLVSEFSSRFPLGLVLESTGQINKRMFSVYSGMMRFIILNLAIPLDKPEAGVLVVELAVVLDSVLFLEPALVDIDTLELLQVFVPQSMRPHFANMKLALTPEKLRISVDDTLFI